MDDADLRRALARPPARLTATAGAAAVAVVFSTTLDLLLVRRAVRPGDPWSGHLALPGGRVEAGESAFDAAIRETLEEVGLALDPAWAAGPLDDAVVHGGRPGLVLHPFVFLLPGGFPPLACRAGEIEEALAVPFRVLSDGQGRSRMTWSRPGGPSLLLPRVAVPGTEVPLWGLTLHVLDGLLDRLDGRGVGLARTPEEP